MKPSVPNNNFPENNDYISRQRALERIHAVGGTGAAPDTWADGYDKGVDAAYKTVQSAPAADSRIVELMNAEAQGRLKVLPCKVGDTVYEHDCVRIYESVITSIIITDNRLLFHTTGVGFDETAIGSSIFLTREEAQMALEGGSNK